MLPVACSAPRAHTRSTRSRRACRLASASTCRSRWVECVAANLSGSHVCTPGWLPWRATPSEALFQPHRQAASRSREHSANRSSALALCAGAVRELSGSPSVAKCPQPSVIKPSCALARSIERSLQRSAPPLSPAGEPLLPPCLSLALLVLYSPTPLSPPSGQGSPHAR